MQIFFRKTAVAGSLRCATSGDGRTAQGGHEESFVMGSLPNCSTLRDRHAAQDSVLQSDRAETRASNYSHDVWESTCRANSMASCNTRAITTKPGSER